MEMATSEVLQPIVMKDLISEASQTMFRDSESQYLNWDATIEPPQHPSNFSRGQRLHYPILYNPVWPVHIAARKKEVPLFILKKNDAFKSYALKGMTLSERERRPIKKTLLFPHRNTNLPFTQPTPRVVKEHVYEQCNSLSLQVVEELEPHVVFKSILEKMPQHDAKDRNSRATSIQKILLLGPTYVDDPRPPVSYQRISKRRHSQTKAKDKQSPLERPNGEPLEIIFVNEGQRCGIHGATIDVPKVKNCEIHGDSGIIQEDENKPPQA